jgi:hypothetical protein
MKKVNLVWVIIIVLIAGCKQSNTHSDDLITVDVTASYPKKELILQDFTDVEYIALETTDDFITQGLVQNIGKKFIIVRNRTGDGDIFIFDRKTGKGIKKINRKGQGGEEYTTAFRVVLDEDKDEIFVNDNDIRKILVYDLNGNFKRSFKHKEGTRYENVYDFDRENLICHDASSLNRGQSFRVISKQDGSIVKDIQIPFEEKKYPWLKVRDEATGMNYILAPSSYYPIIPYFNNWILVEPSSDTIYNYSPDYTMTPIIIKTPPILSMDPEVMLFVGTVTDRYYFMVSVKMEGDVMAMTGLQSTDLMYDKQEKAIFRYTIYSNDYSNDEQVYMMSRPVNNEIPSGLILEAPDLVKAYGKGQLKGRLKEIAATLDEESNPVIMLIKHKKK